MSDSFRNKAIAIGFFLILPLVSHAQSIGQAVDNESLVWGSSGASSASWFGQTTVTHDGVDAARSGAITHGQQSDLTTTVTGPGTLSFWWKVSSENNPGTSRYDILYFWYGDSKGMLMIFGEVDWQQKTVQIPAGTHTLNWSYAKDISGSAGMDAGFLDQVVWTPEEEPPPPPPEPELSTELGELLWSKSEHKGIGHNYIRGVEFDTDGNLVLAGFFQTTGTTTSASDAHIMAVTPDAGELVWEDTFDSNITDSVDRFYGVKRDGLGNIYAVGTVNGTYPHTATLIRKYDPGGTFLWERRYGTSPWGEAIGIGIDGSNAIYTSGRDFGSWGSHEGRWSILKYSQDGTLQSGYPIFHNVSSSLNCPDVANGIAVDEEGNFYAVGQVGVTPSNTYNWHVRAYDKNRVLRWTDTISTPTVGVDIAHGAVLDGKGHLYVSGRIWNGTNTDMHVVKYACTPPPGNGLLADRVWERSFPSDFVGKNSNAIAIAIAPDGAIYVGGNIVDNADVNQAALLRLHPANGDVLASQFSDLPTHSVLYSMAFRKRQLGWGGYVHNGTDWDYMYGMMLVPPGPQDGIAIY